MRILLPPSETKRDGGNADAPLDLTALSFPSLHRPRRRALQSLRLLASNLTTMSEALRLGATQRPELLRNRAVRSSPTMPALERYTGVLYDGIDASSLSESARWAAGGTVIIHSALFGLLGADDPIPAYRVSHDSRLPGLTLGGLWREPVTAELTSFGGLVLDLRSEAYVGLGPLPPAEHRFFLRVVTQRADGTVRALNHFNKKGKGEFVRAVLESAPELTDVGDLLDWAAGVGIRLRPGAPGELELVVDQPAPAR